MALLTTWVLYGVSNAALKNVPKGTPDLVVIFTIHVTMTCISGSILLIARLTGHAQFKPDVQDSWWIPVYLTGACWAIAGFAVVSSYSLGASVAQVGGIISAVPIASCLAYLLWNGVMPTRSEIIGTLVIIAGAVIMFGKIFDPPSPK